jgi:glycosyltransferase involved in cell wall biosynthesis
MRVSIITPSYNQAAFIGDTITSVLDQDHDDIEHIVVDGGSTDGTLAILSTYPHLRWLSERDRGQGHALNKGFAMATGEIVAWLNSDDYYEPKILGKIVRYFADHPDCGIVYGDITFVRKDRSFISEQKGGTISYASMVKNPDIIRQPSFFWRKSAMESVGEIDESLHLVMDFDFFVRLCSKHRLCYLPLNLSYYRFYDENKSSATAYKQFFELRRVFRKNGIGMSLEVMMRSIARSMLSPRVRGVLKTLLGRRT